MKDYIRLLYEHLGDLLRLRSVYLLLDLAPCHTHDSIYELAKSKGLRLLFVPPSMTFLLQPTDAHCFSHFKFTVEEAWREQKGRASGGQVTLLMWTKSFLMQLRHCRCMIGAMPSKVMAFWTTSNGLPSFSRQPWMGRAKSSVFFRVKNMFFFGFWGLLVDTLEWL